MSVGAISRFRTKMAYHEKRAHKLGLHKTAKTLAVVRDAANPKDERWMREQAAVCRNVSGTHAHARQVAWFYERAAEALARLRADTREAAVESTREEAAEVE